MLKEKDNNATMNCFALKKIVESRFAQENLVLMYTKNQ